MCLYLHNEIKYQLVMATTFTIRTTKKSGETALIARVQRPEHKIDIRLTTGLKVDIFKWNKAKESIKSGENYRRENKSLFDKMSEIEKALDDASRDGSLTADEAKEKIMDIVNRESRENERKRREEKKRMEEEAKRVTFMQYFRQLVKDIQNGDAVSNKDMTFAEQSRKNYNTSLHKLEKYERARHTALDWDDIDMDFFEDFTKYLRHEGAKQNSIAKHIRTIKAVMHRAHDKGLTTNTVFVNNRFRVSEVDVDAVYLTRDEVESIKAVDLSGMSIGHEWARDIFLVGIHTAQRVSDYNNIQPEDIVTTVKKEIVTDENGNDKIATAEKTVIYVQQKKTGTRVCIPVKSELREILDKYNNNLPHLHEVKINAYIKDICRMAGINSQETITSIKGGKKVSESFEKWELVRSHTARRTGCTWMYLSGMDALDICKISGHSSVKMLMKYIKSTELENAMKIAEKYDYFK